MHWWEAASIGCQNCQKHMCNINISKLLKIQIVNTCINNLGMDFYHLKSYVVNNILKALVQSIFHQLPELSEAYTCATLIFQNCCKFKYCLIRSANIANNQNVKIDHFNSSVLINN